MSDSATLTAELRKEVLALEDDLRARVDRLSEVSERWRGEYDAARAAERTAASWEAWRDERVTLDRYATAGGAVVEERAAGTGAALTAADTELILSFFERAEGLAPEARARLAAGLVKRFEPLLIDTQRIDASGAPERVLRELVSPSGPRASQSS